MKGETIELSQRKNPIDVRIAPSYLARTEDRMLSGNRHRRPKPLNTSRIVEAEGTSAV
jgi:hypothetical protein